MLKRKFDEPFLKILTLFTIWRLALFVVLFVSIKYLSLQANFLGGGLTYYLQNPYLWSFINFDGEHFLAIAQRGYRDLEYFFFPLYPLFVKIFSGLIGDQIVTHAITGLLISNVAFIASLIGLFKLIKLDFKENIAFITIILLLSFPTSFYFAAYYSESLFLALCVWSFYFARCKNWWLSGLLGMLATATRLVGIGLLPALLYEAYVQYRKKEISLIKILPVILLIPVGLIAYTFYLYQTTGNPLEFFTNVGIYGQQRSTDLILLPQVLYRYVFKILPIINYNYFPVVISTWLEFISGVLFAIFVFLAFIKTRTSYAIFSLIAYIMPTLSGSFSSMSRYVLVLFPAFIVYALYYNKADKRLRTVILTAQIILLAITAALFLRGYWIA
jgi:Gpi18-like mannosyltransferase